MDYACSVFEPRWLRTPSLPQRKATRVSHSTSHAEALSAIGTTQVAQLIANRLTEPFASFFMWHTFDYPVSAMDLAYLQENSLHDVVVDHVTDCMDLYELVCGHKGLSADKNQRLIITSLREDRSRGAIRRFMHWPTTVMLADGLTKTGNFAQLLRFATTGLLLIRLPNDKYIRMRVWTHNHTDDTENTVSRSVP